MRDVLIIAIVLVGALVALRRPWVGVMLWTWLSIMNPHRMAWGIAYDAPLAAVAAGSTLLGLLITRDRALPFKAPVVVVFLLFMLWMSFSWLLGLDPADDYYQWNKVMKIDFMILVALALLSTKKHIVALTWVAAGSLALLGAKGGLFTLMTGGNYRVWGPPDSFITDNNEFALAMVMTIPLLRFLQLQLRGAWPRHGMTVVMVLCLAAALGTHSRGALIALAVVSLSFWWRSKSRMLGGVLMAIVGISLLAFMPDVWTERMASITEYQQDRSAMGRISAWWTAWNLAFHYPFGAGFNAARPELFAIFSPYPEYVHAAHSIYFQILGNHGFVGLALFLIMWLMTWRTAGWLRKHGAKEPETKWCSELGAMCQVSLLAYAVGGAFLSLSYFDLPYNVMVLVVLAQVWVKKRAWQTEPAYAPRWRLIPGLAAVGKPP